MLTEPGEFSVFQKNLSVDQDVFGVSATGRVNEGRQRPVIDGGVHAGHVEHRDVGAGPLRDTPELTIGSERGCSGGGWRGGTFRSS